MMEGLFMVTNDFSVITSIATLISVIGGTLAAVNMIRILRERKIYSTQVRSLFIQVLLYSLTSNEALVNCLLRASDPVKTYEVYSIELSAMKNQLVLLDKVDLSKVTTVYQKNIQAYLYQYRKYLSCAEEYLCRLKKRSDYLKDLMKNEHEFRSVQINVLETDSEDAIKEFLDSEYKIDYLLVESDSVIQREFIELLENLRTILQELLEATKNETISQATDIESLYLDFLHQNEAYK